MTEALALRGITRYFGRHAVLENVSVEVPEHGRLVVEGPNGAGKTTLLRIMAGGLRPTTGKVAVFGRSQARSGDLAFVPQSAPVYRDLDGLQQIRWWASIHGHTLTKDNALRLAADAGIDRIVVRPAGTYSQGQRQRLAIACALAAQPRLLILDEPASSLDVAGTAWLKERLAAYDGAVVAALHGDAILPGADRIVLGAP